MNDAPQSWPCTSSTCSRLLLEAELARQQWICDRCLAGIRSWLAELPNQLIVLRASAQREITGSGGRTGTRTPPLPGREDVLSLIGPAAWTDVHDVHGDQTGPIPVMGTLSTWVRLICEERGWYLPGAVTEEGLAEWLAHAPRLAWVSRQEWAGEMHDELLGMIHAVRGITQVRPRSRPVPQPCPRCDGLTLVETDWQTYIHCGGCEAQFTRDELALAARIAMAS